MHVALAVTVHSATDIAELGSAPAAHMVAALSLLDPPLALVALFESHALCELEERRVVFVHFLLDIVLLTGHSVVVEALTIQAVCLLAHRAVQDEVVSFLIHERELAISRRTP